MRAGRHWLGERRGAALVEFALVVVLLMTLVLGIIEFGTLAMDKLTLTQGAREGARAASLGRTVDNIEERIRSAAATLNEDDITIAMTYSTDDGATWPYTLGDNAAGTANNAPAGSLIKIQCAYPHTMVTGDFFAWWSGVVDGKRPIGTVVVMRRE